MSAISAVTSIFTGNSAAKAQTQAANTAAAAQTAASEAAIEEQRRQFDALQEALKPYTEAGVGALSGQQDLLGLNGADSQQAAIDAINNSSAMQTYLQQGENAILQNSSATGGLRGGNTQAALAQFRPQLLNQLINQQYTNLGGLTSIGQNAASGVGNAGMQSANSISSLLQTAGAANASAALASGQAKANQYTNTGSAIGGLAGTLGSILLGGF